MPSHKITGFYKDSATLATQYFYVMVGESVFKLANAFDSKSKVYTLKKYTKSQLALVKMENGNRNEVATPRDEFYCRIIDARTEFGDDVRLILENGNTVLCSQEYDPNQKSSFPTIRFFSPSQLVEFDVSTDFQNMPKILFEE